MSDRATQISLGQTSKQLGCQNERYNSGKALTVQVQICLVVSKWPIQNQDHVFKASLSKTEPKPFSPLMSLIWQTFSNLTPLILNSTFSLLRP